MATDSGAREPEVGREGLMESTKRLESCGTKGTNDSLSFSDVESRYLFVCETDCKLSTEEKTVSKLCSDVDFTEDEAERNASYRLDSVNGNIITEKGMEEVGPDEDVGLATNYLSIDDSSDLIVQPKGGNYSDIFENTYQLQSTLLSESDKAEVTKMRTSSNTDINNNAVPTESLNLMVWDSDDSEQIVQVPRTTYKNDLAKTEVSLNGCDRIHTSPQDADEMDYETSLGQTDMKASDNIETAAEATRTKSSTNMTSSEPFPISDANECTKTDILNGTIIEQNKLVPGSDWTEIFSVTCTTEYIDEAEWTNLSPSEKEHNEERVTGDSEAALMHHTESTHDKTSQGQLKGQGACVNGSLKPRKPDREDNGSQGGVISYDQIKIEDINFTERTISKTGENGSLKFIIRTVKAADCEKNVNKSSQSTEGVSIKRHKRHKDMSRKSEKPLSNDANNSQVIAKSNGKSKINKQAIQSRHVNKRKFSVSCKSFDEFRSSVKISKKKKYKHTFQSTKARRVLQAFKRFPHCSKVRKMKSMWTTTNEEADTERAAAKWLWKQNKQVTKNRSVREDLKKTTQGIKSHKVEEKKFKLLKLNDADLPQTNTVKTQERNLKDISRRDIPKERKKCHRRVPLMYTCAQCKTAFKDRGLLSIHLRTIHADIYNFSCRLCSFTSETIAAIRNHYLGDHKRVRAFECDFPSCTFNTNKIQRLLKHQRRHPKNGHEDAMHCDPRGRSLSCKYCGLIYMTMKMLEKHYAEVHVNCRPFHCTILGCGYNAARMRRLQVHYKQHAKEEEQHPKNKTSHGGSVRRGLSGTSKTTVPLYSHHCPHCEARFMRQADLSRHVQNNHTDSSHLRCRFCSISAKSVKQLQRHCDEVHENRHPFQCNAQDCTFISRRFHELKKHQFRMHSQTKEFVCESCGASFKSMHDLSNHTRSCLELQEFLCDACGQTFNHLQSLQIHHRSVHDGLKPFNCSQCGKSFGDRSNLRRHIRIHKNMFPYSCNICRKSFRHSNSLKSHMNTHGEVLT